ncbi:MAG: dihydrolipoyl dehydrogenase [Halofilum sp. (in: g-proteobacteria)]|nr:dihydrolipoyl dehydrogenase [Halofilum sp. (in: g-proteobacteria)]
MAKSFDAVVVGGGPAGYVCAIRLAQLGFNTACVDNWVNKQNKPALGGTCLNVGCIPSKELLESSHHFSVMRDSADQYGIKCKGVEADVPTMIKNKDKTVGELTKGIEGLFKANKVEWLAGKGQLTGTNSVKVTPHSGEAYEVEAKNVVLACGSVPIEIGAAPLHEDVIVDSAGALDWEECPKRLGVIGAGVIGLEMGSVWARLGAEVTVLEAMDTFLAPCDQEVSKAAFKCFQKQGLDIRLGTRVLSTKVKGSKNKTVEIEYEDNKGKHTLTVDRLIVAVGRRPNTDGIAASNVQLEIDEGGRIHVDGGCETSLPGVHAIGDAVRGPMLAHKGSEEGIVVAERLAGQRSHVNYDAIPWVIYTHPEIAWVGQTEQELKHAGTEYRSGTFPFLASGRAKAMHDTDGLVKVIADAKTDRVLGVHIVGPQASELIGQAVLAMEFDASAEDIMRTVFAHPTLSEAIHEAALAVDGRPIHIPPPRKKK